MGYSRKWNHADTTTIKPLRDKGLKRRVLAICSTAIVLSAAIVSFYFLQRTGKKPPKSDTTAKVHQEKHRAPRLTNQAIAPANELAIDERRTVNGKIIKVPKNPFGTPIPKDLEYKAIWEYTPEDYARVDPGYAARHEKFLAAQAANPWKTPSDRSLSMLLFAKDGNMGLLIPFDASGDRH